MIPLSIEVEGLDQLQKNFKQSPQITARAADKAIKKSIFTLIGNARKHTPVDQGFLRGAGMVTEFGLLLGVLQNVAPYAVYVHEGTTPHWPPPGALAGWAQRHGIPEFLVRRSIGTKGTKAQPFFQDSIEESQNDIDRFFKEALDDISNQLMQ